MAHKILLVDDDPLFSRLAESLLKKQDWQVTAVTEGAGALTSLAQQPIDILITDLDMPGMNGLELIRKVRKERPGLPIVVLTGAGSEGDAVKTFRCGANDYVTKSNVHDELVAVTNQLLEDSGAKCAMEALGEPTQSIPEKARRTSTTGRGQPQLHSPKKSADKPGDDASTAKARKEATLDSEYRIHKRAMEPTAEMAGGANGTLASEYIIRQRSSFVREEPVLERALDTFGGIITVERLAVLRRQMQRIVKWSDLVGSTKRNGRRHQRRSLGEIVEIRPLTPQEVPPVAPIQSFCKDLSVGGCSLLHHELIHGDQWIVSLSKVGSAPIEVRCKVMRTRIVIFGMYDIGLRFLERSTNSRNPLSTAACSSEASA